ncbi:L-threonine 3-O-phosphate decarboxylase [Richelia intracellularis HH01]|jgi:L-threonine-O-3-phosphate decarboxylase|uniref:threonine-phosphate decarboxylase n=1 Tax=Richelia intracellularis HH01 TaxID=1165094 RepID=M1X2B4_9NOST|nr:threonine-phosphate decarboxylase CobD [Richelia intracellularis]CCH66530.1 L-threonine 3-O-phosphate decarboxylase [Richelia intracellularis HH01]
MIQPAHGGNLVWAARLVGCSPSAILDFSASISPLGPPHSILTAIKSQLANIKNYPDPSYSELRLALSHFHKLHPDWILPGNGSAELLTLLGREFAELTGTILITPAFGDYYRTLKSYNANFQEICLFEENEKVKSKSRRGKGEKDIYLISTPMGQQAKLPHSINTHTCGLLINNPHNPTGGLFMRETIIPCLEKFSLVVIDEAFMNFLCPEEEQSLISWVHKYPNLVILRSLTKFYSLPGLRLGYAITNPQRLKRWGLWRDPWPVNTLAEVAGIKAIQDIHFQEKTWAWLKPTKWELFQGLEGIDGLQPLPSTTNFLLVKSQFSVAKLQFQLLQQHQILIRDCLSFPQLGDHFFRVAVRTSGDNNYLLSALRQIMHTL